LLLKAQGDYGWPECYYDAFAQKLVLAPEYGGDGGKAIGVCADKIGPVAAVLVGVYYDPARRPL